VARQEKRIGTLAYRTSAGIRSRAKSCAVFTGEFGWVNPRLWAVDGNSDVTRLAKVADHPGVSEIPESSWLHAPCGNALQAITHILKTPGIPSSLRLCYCGRFRRANEIP